MDVKRYVQWFLIALTTLVVVIVAWGLYVNIASNSRIAEKVAGKYVILTGTKAKRREISAVVDDLVIRVSTLWKSDIEAQQSGTVSNFNVRSGQIVKKGDIICELVNTDILGQIASAEASVAEAQADLINAEQRARRYEMLVDKDAVSKADYDTAIAARDAARARLTNRLAQRDITVGQKEKLAVTAPRDGMVVQTYVKYGAYVTLGQPLVMLADIHQMEIEMQLTKEMVDILGLDNDKQDYVLEVPKSLLFPHAYPIYVENGKGNGLEFNQFFITPVRLIPDKPGNMAIRKVYWQTNNASGILEPTTYQHAKIYSLKTQQALSVPIRAVNDYYNQNENYVFVLDGNGRLKKRYVKTGVVDEDYVEIVSGLTEGEVVIVSDIEGLNEGMRVQVDLLESEIKQDKRKKISFSYKKGTIVNPLENGSHGLREIKGDKNVR